MDKGPDKGPGAMGFDHTMSAGARAQTTLDDGRPNQVALHAVLELAGVLSRVVVATRGGDEPVVVDRPLLVPADPHRLPGPTGSGVGAGERPTNLSAYHRTRAVKTGEGHG